MGRSSNCAIDRSQYAQTSGLMKGTVNSPSCLVPTLISVDDHASTSNRHGSHCDHNRSRIHPTPSTSISSPTSEIDEGASQKTQ